MSQVPAWFERKFEFTFPVEQYPNLCVRLRGTPIRIEEMLRGVAIKSAHAARRSFILRRRTRRPSFGQDLGVG